MARAYGREGAQAGVDIMKFKVGDKITFGKKYPGVVTKTHRIMGGYTIIMSEGRYKNKDYRASEQSLSIRK